MAGRPKKILSTKNLDTVSKGTKLLKLRQDFLRNLVFDTALDMDEWADLERVLPRAAAAEYGQWRTSRFPFLRRIMKVLSPSSIAKVIPWMKGSQVGATEIAICFLLYSARCNPGPSMYTQKTQDSAYDFSKNKLKPSIDACKALEYILGEKKSKNFPDSIDNKSYAGGFIVLGGANSSTFLRSKSVKIAICDEFDTYDSNISDEGAPEMLIAKRQVTFSDRKLYLPTTPLFTETSRVEPMYEAGSQEQYYVPCPHCNPDGDHEGFMFVIEWDMIKWEKRKDGEPPDNVWLECPNCAGHIDENKNKTWMLDNGDWFSMKGSDTRYKVGDVENPSFQLASFYSPVGFFSWRDAVLEWYSYLRDKDINKLQVIVNQTWGKTFSLEGGEVAYSLVQQRAEAYCGKFDTFDVPHGAYLLTAGADIQDDRIECTVYGWGTYHESWAIEHVVIPGDTSLFGDKNGLLPDGQPSVWRLFDDFLAKRFKHQDGVEMPIEVAMIDSGYKTEEVHVFCRTREHRRIFPVKGQPGWGKGLYKRQQRRHERYGTIPFYAQTDELKNKMYAQLMIADPGPGYIHFPKKPCFHEKFYRGLTCESRKTKTQQGRTVLYWDNPSGARNEPTDCRNYAYVAFLSYPVNIEDRARVGLASIFNNIGTSSGIKRRRGSKGL